jgi:hypothetical protein
MFLSYDVIMLGSLTVFKDKGYPVTGHAEGTERK